jgi:hypothetical protein
LALSAAIAALSTFLTFWRNTMHSFLTKFRQGAAAFLVGLGIGSFLIGPAALALVFPGQYAPRYFPTQQVHYERHIINITAGSVANSSVATVDGAQNICIFTITTACSVRIGAVPYNSFIVRATQQVVTACNGTTCTLALGTSSGGVNLVAAQSITASGGATALTVVAANAGIAATGNNVTASGANGGFDLWATLADATAGATAGTIVIVVEYFGPNDGGCLPNVPMASTAGPC